MFPLVCCSRVQRSLLPLSPFSLPLSPFSLHLPPFSLPLSPFPIPPSLKISLYSFGRSANLGAVNLSFDIFFSSLLLLIWRKLQVVLSRRCISCGSYWMSRVWRRIPRPANGRARRGDGRRGKLVLLLPVLALLCAGPVFGRVYMSPPRKKGC